jgi:dTDP-glucose 4,6-dehydratase
MAPEDDRPATILVTGGSGFIGSALVRRLIRDTAHRVVNVDALTYAATPEALAEVEDDPRYAFERADIADAPAMHALFARHRPDAVVNLAAESHVDRSIDRPAAFVETNVVGTQVLLEAARAHWQGLDGAARAGFRLLHVSTDEVFGELGDTGAFDEASPYRPNSPYAASKAGADHLVRAWHRTYGLPVLLTNCSNNYGPWQFPEKLIPLMIAKALGGEALPVYGRGEQVRDWLHVDDHVDGLLRVLRGGAPGRSYNIGGAGERRNIEVVQSLCRILDALAPRADGRGYAEQIAFVADRPGHDRRYAIDAARIREELGWRPARDVETGLRETVAWYLDHRNWWRRVLAERYGGERLGTGS